jgi:predicted dienelactone hydrolase
LAGVLFTALTGSLLLGCSSQDATTPADAPPASPTREATPADFPLSEPGPHEVGVRTFEAEDPTRDDRTVAIRVYYPAVLEPDDPGTASTPGAVPDPSGAPYPLILSSTKVASIFAPLLVSHGFAWASVDNLDSYYPMDAQLIDQPRDILFALEQVATDPPEALDGLIDTDQAGAIGYSFDGYNALALSGARVDPAYYQAQCPTPDTTTAAIVPDPAYICGPAGAWEEFAAHAGEAITASADGLWQPMTDPRIRAVMPMAAEGWWLFGERGLAAVDRPILMIAGTTDELYQENALVFERLGTPDKAMISFVGRDHGMIFEPEMIARMGHFAVAFFGQHLQGRPEMAPSISPDFVAQFTDLAWGPQPVP